MSKSKTTNMTGASFANLVAQHLEPTAVGLAALNPGVPAQVFVPALADALGSVLSKFTASPDIAMTLALRNSAIDAFRDAIRNKTPAIQFADTVNAQAS